MMDVKDEFVGRMVVEDGLEGGCFVWVFVCGGCCQLESRYTAGGLVYQLSILIKGGSVAC